MTRRRAVIALAVLGAVVVAGAAASWLIVRVWGPMLTSDRIAAIATAAAGRPARVDGVVFEPLRGRVRVLGLTVAGAPDGGGEPMLHLERLDVSARIESVWRRELVIEVAATGVDLRLEPLPPTTQPFVFEMPERLQLGPVSARLASLSLARGRLRYVDRAAAFDLEVGGLAAEGRPDGGALILAARADRLELGVAGVRESFARLAADGRIDAARVLVQRLDVGGEGREIRIAGSIETPWDRPMLAGEVKARFDLGVLARHLGAAVPAGGEAVVAMMAAGPVTEPLLTGRIDVARLDVGAVQARDLSASFRLDEGGLAVRDLAGRVLGGQLAGSLEIPAADAGAAVARARLAHVDVAALARAAGAGIDVAGRLALEGEARGDPARPASLRAQLRAEGSELAFGGDLARLGTGRLDALVRLDAGQVASEVQGRWPAATLVASARLDPDRRLRVDGRGTADLSGLPGWRDRDGADLRVRAEGRWPQVVLSGVLDLTRAARDGAERLEVRLDPVTGSASRWSGTARARRLSLPWVALEGLQSRLAASEDAFEVLGFEARVSGVPVQASARWAWSGTGVLQATAGPLALAALPGVDPRLGLEGSGRVEVQASVSQAGAEASARIEGDKVAVARVPLGRGDGHLTLKGRRLEASLRFPELELGVQGDVAPGQTLRARAALRSLDLEPLVGPGRQGEPPLLRGTVSADADLAIAVDAPQRPRGTLVLRPRGLAVAGTAWSSADPVVVRLDGQRANLDAVRLHGQAGVITAQGIVWDAGGPSAIRIALEGGRLLALAPSLGVDGRVRVEATLSGEAGALPGARARANLEGEGIALPGALAALGEGTIRMEAALADGAVSLSRGAVSWPGLSGDVTGRIGLDGRLALEARSAASAERLGKAMGRDDLAGSVKASATIGGRFARPEGRARVESDRLSFAGVTLERIDAAARLQGDTLRLDRLTATLYGARLSGHGEWTPGGSARGQLAIDPVALAGIPTLPARLALGGSLSLNLEATSTREGATAVAQVRLTGGRVAGLSLGAGQLSARLDGRQLSADLTLADRRVTGAASGILQSGGSLEGTVDLDRLELAPLLRHLAPERAGDLEVTTAGRIGARVPWDRPAALSARARLQPLVLRSRSAGIEGQGLLESRFENAVLTLERVEIGGTLGEVRASGTLDTSGRMDVALDVRTPLRALVASVAEVGGAEGTVVATLRLTGTAKAPIARGEASLTGGRLALRGHPEPLRDISARILATPEAIRLTEATAGLGAGRFSATGEAALATGTLGPYRAQVAARDIALRPLDGLATVWNADLALTGSQGKALLSGDLRLVRGSYSRDLISLSAMLAPERVPRAPGLPLPLRLRVILDDNLVVRTPQARLRVGGTLNIHGTAAAPTVLGVLEARDGTLLFRGYRYQVERGVVRFADPRRIDPLLDVVATTRIGEYDVTMRVDGHVRNLDVKLSSSPPLPRDQLLSLVAFGTVRGEVGQGAGGAVAGEAAKLLANELFDLSGTESVLPGPLQRAMERTRVTYTHNSEDVGRFGLRVEYEVWGPFLIAGERTSEGYYILDGVVRLRFR